MVPARRPACCRGGYDDDDDGEEEEEEGSEDREFGLLLFQLMKDVWRGLVRNFETGCRAEDNGEATVVGMGTDELGSRDTGARKAGDDDDDDKPARRPLFLWWCMFIDAIG